MKSEAINLFKESNSDYLPRITSAMAESFRETFLEEERFGQRKIGGQWRPAVTKVCVGGIFWLPKKKDIPEGFLKIDPNLVELEPEAFDHPILVLDIDWEPGKTREHVVQFLFMTSSENKSRMRFAPRPQQQREFIAEDWMSFFPNVHLEEDLNFFDRNKYSCLRDDKVYHIHWGALRLYQHLGDKPPMSIFRMEYPCFALLVQYLRVVLKRKDLKISNYCGTDDLELSGAWYVKNILDSEKYGTSALVETEGEGCKKSWQVMNDDVEALYSDIVQPRRA